MVVGLVLVSGGRLAAQSVPSHADSLSAAYLNRAFCVVRPDTSVPWMSTGYSFRGESRARGGRVIWRAYPVVTEVIPNSAADSAGLRVGDEIIANYGFDLSREFEKVAAHRPKGPGIPIPMKVRRGSMTIDITLVPRPGNPPTNCTPPSFIRDSIAKARSKSP
jgi:C-terminal processing protease CtpA/Prc